MLYRECRIETHREIFRELMPQLSIQDLFLLLGGIKNNVFILKFKSLQFFYMSGFDTLVYTDSFEKFNIAYEELDVREFLNLYNEDNSFKNDNIFIVPFPADILNKRAKDYKGNTLFGSSYLPISTVNYQEEKIIFKNTNVFEKEDWVDFDMVNQLLENCLWLDDVEMRLGYKICVINKSNLKRNTELLSKLNFNRIERLKKVGQDFLKDSNYYWEIDKVMQISGPQAYDFIHDRLEEMKKGLTNNSNPEKKILALKYIKFQLTQLGYFISTGTDGYYRNEFADVVRCVGEEHQCKRLIYNSKKWEESSKVWRKISRNLNHFVNGEKGIIDSRDVIDSLLLYIEEIKEREINAMKELIEISNDLLIK